MVKSKASTVTQLLVTAFSMLIVPVTLFFVGKWYLFAELENSDVYSAVIAILAVHVILGIYCYVAYQEVVEDSQHPAPVSQLKKVD